MSDTDSSATVSVAFALSDRGPVHIHGDATGMLVARRDGRDLLTAKRDGDVLRLGAGMPAEPDGLHAVLEHCFAAIAGPTLMLVSADPAWAPTLSALGGEWSGGFWRLWAGQAMQCPASCLPGGPRTPFPMRYAFTGGQRHPVRPAKPDGTVYARWIPWLNGVLSFRRFAPEDLPVFHRWMNDPRVDFFWSEAGTIEKHRDYLAQLDADPHMTTLLGCFDGRPFSYFELYWARENRLGPYYDAWDHDRGWHVVVGEDSCRGRDWVTAWLPSLMHYMFLDEPRTQRIVGEPRSDHAGQLRNLDRAGFGRIKHVVLPHKEAVLVRLERERFFSDRLWAPQPGAPSTAQSASSGLQPA